ncbi:uncharacterized protein B0H64DRAFT_465021, partial [Chaetomium fimeti]
ALQCTAKLWRAVVVIPSFPLHVASLVVATIQCIIAQLALLVLLVWDSHLSFANINPDAQPGLKVRISRTVKQVWGWLAKYELFVQFASFLFCRLVPGGPPWLYVVACRLFLLTIIIAQSTMEWVLVWVLVGAAFEFACFTFGRGLLVLVHLDRFWASIPVILPLAGLGSPGVREFLQGGINTTWEDEMTQIGQAYYFLMASRVFLGAFTVVAKHIAVKQDWVALKFWQTTRQTLSIHD